MTALPSRTRLTIGVAVMVLCLAATAAPAYARPPGKKAQGKAKSAQLVRFEVAITEPVPTAVVARVTPSVVYINGKDCKGSGFLLLPNVIATNSHVIRNEMMEDVTVRFVDAQGAAQTAVKPRLIYENKARDLALLWIPRQPQRPVVELRHAFEPGPNQTVFVVGNPSQGSGVIRVNAHGAAIAHDTVMIENLPFVQLRLGQAGEAIDVGPGTSGGPVFDLAGRVIGVLTQGDLDDDGIPTGRCFCVPADAIKAALTGLPAETDWESIARAANARHRLDIAAINYHLTSKLAQGILKDRMEIVKKARKHNLAEVLRLDAELIDAFRTCDRMLNELADPAYRGTIAGNEWNESDRRSLVDLRGTADEIRRLVSKGRVSTGEAKRCEHLFEQNERAFQRLSSTSGLTDRIIDEMKQNLTNSLNAKLRRR